MTAKFGGARKESDEPLLRIYRFGERDGRVSRTPLFPPYFQTEATCIHASLCTQEAGGCRLRSVELWSGHQFGFEVCADGSRGRCSPPTRFCCAFRVEGRNYHL